MVNQEVAVPATATAHTDTIPEHARCRTCRGKGKLYMLGRVDDPRFAQPCQRCFGTGDAR